ncbi:MAG: 30S ribosomal protein S12 methylthiotransferase RimO [Ignavibacteriales bacterium]|nr:30S ribosomal protein S12 methylthiotransferase RimO [Ignavibacteriales bacterium]
MQGKRQRISVVTLGCAKNIVDSEVLLGQLKTERGVMVTDIDDAEVAVINTCGFIDAAKQESIDAIMEAVERKSKGTLKKVVVMGCLSERYARELATEVPEVDAFYGSNQLKDVLCEVGVDFKQELLGERLLSTPSHFAYLKISEGCDHPCSFCAIPLMRGLHRSKPEEDILLEARSLAARGIKELIVIAQDTTYYGLDLYGERRLSRLVGKLSEIDGVEWIRLMYAYPSKFPLDLIDAMASSRKVCRYLDIPIQHASDPVLKSMRRGITNRATRQLIETLKSKIPDIALRTTLIVGYPNESETDFQVLYDFVKETEFHRLGVFPYSQEEGTFAYDLGDRIPAEIKEERKKALMEVQKAISQKRNESLVGSTVRVLVDRKEKGHAVGRTEWDAPEIDQEVFVENHEGLGIGHFFDVRVVDAVEYDLYATSL